MSLEKYNKTQTKNGPSAKYSAGGVTATVWKKTFEGKEIVNVHISRSYKNKDGQWKQTNSFSVQDLPKVQAVAQKAFEYAVFKE